MMDGAMVEPAVPDADRDRFMATLHHAALSLVNA